MSLEEQAAAAPRRALWALGKFRFRPESSEKLLQDSEVEKWREPHFTFKLTVYLRQTHPPCGSRALTGGLRRKQVEKEAVAQVSDHCGLGQVGAGGGDRRKLSQEVCRRQNPQGTARVLRAGEAEGAVGEDTYTGGPVGGVGNTAEEQVWRVGDRELSLHALLVVGL